MGWVYQCRIAGLIARVSSNSAACQQDMLKFLCLYEPDDSRHADVEFQVIKHEDYVSFVYVSSQHPPEILWQSRDAREVSAALEIHFYRNIIERLHDTYISIHAAALNVGGHGCMFAGVSGAGKSSICTAGLLAGAKYLSDEFSLLSAVGDLAPFARPMQWEHPTHPAFDRQNILDTALLSDDTFEFPDAAQQTATCWLWYPKNIQRADLPLRVVVLHQYQAELSKAEIREIPRYEALMALPEHMHVQQGMAIDLPLLNQRIPQRCRFYRLHFPNVFQAWQLVEMELLKFSADSA